jgi:adenylate cyclase
MDWQALLVDGYEPLKKAQRIFRRLPHDPRCQLCRNPFEGVGGWVLGRLGRKPSRKNPNLCQYCFDHLPEGGLEIDIGIVFADVRGSTSIGEKSSATAFAATLNAFYKTATDVVIAHNGIIDKLIGDEVMALLVPGFAGTDYRRQAAGAAIALAKAVQEHGLPVGVAANAGVAFVGNVGSGTVMDFTALGDPVNLGARLQSEAQPGQVVLVEELYQLVSADHPGAPAQRIDVRGREEPVDVRVLTV